MSRLRASWLFVAAVSASFLIISLPSFADSQARMVRLSNVEGKVQVDRGAGQGFEKAFLNLPITQGMAVRTDIDGAAEVELEDGTTVRITPSSRIDFPRLSLTESGTKATTISLHDGTLYVNTSGAKDAELNVSFSQQTLRFVQATHARVEMENATAVVSVFKGEVDATGPKGTSQIATKHSATFDLLGQQEATLQKNLEADPYDSWDKQQQQYHDRYAAASYNSFSPFTYGSSDLNYYGNFSNIDGCGMCWQPYFAGSGWDPFMNGAWALYPGLGYSWVSAYPWGWTPYHSGTWLFAPGFGWAWQPGPTWYGVTGFVPVSNAPSGFHPPVAPAVTTVQAPASTVVVNRGPVPTITKGFFGGKVSIPANSAGLGVPRGGISNLSSVSAGALRTGSISTSTHYSPAVSYGGWGAVGGGSGASRGGTGFSAPHAGSISTSSHPSAGHR
jgi:hypothetical protein